MNLLAAIVLVLASPSLDESPFVSGLYRATWDDGEWGAPHGHVLIQELRCASCHLPEQQEIPAPPPGPNLNGLRHRMDAESLLEMLGSEYDRNLMPRIVSGDQFADEQEALVHFLMSDDGAPPPPAQTADAEAIARGDVLYHSVGCVACHQPMHGPEKQPEAEDDIFTDSTPVVQSDAQLDRFGVELNSDFRIKNLPALTQFLVDPLTVHPDGRMPGMHLSEKEARDIAAYLLRGQEPEVAEPFVVDPEKAERGRQLFSSLRCSACHAREDSVPPEPSPPWETIAKSGEGNCLGPADYYISDLRMIEAMRFALAESVATPTVIESLTALNCFACHERDELGGPLDYRQQFFTAAIDADLGDEGRLPPTLTGVGAKLTEEGLRGILLEGDSVRPYMATRMPDFGEANVAHLIPMFLEEDKNPDAPATNVSGLEHHHRNHYGRQLMGTDGLSCITCHDLSGERSLGIPAIDLALTPGRIQPSWFKQYLLDPASLRPGTRMPAFFTDGVSSFPGLWNGDADKQIEAMWVYLRELDQTRLPVGMEKTENFELVPEDRPIIHRTFMEGIGAQAIAVGFPEGVHVAFDAAKPGFAMAWTGKFIDAESAQADRFTPYVKPLGELVKDVFPDGPPLLLGSSFEIFWPEESDLEFTGYTVDVTGVPEFHYRIAHPDGEHTIEFGDRVHPVGPNKIRRRITCSDISAKVLVRAATSPHLDRINENEYRSDAISLDIINAEHVVLVQKYMAQIHPKADGEGGIVEWEITW